MAVYIGQPVFMAVIVADLKAIQVPAFNVTID
jgi:hypothetical protein